MYSARAASFDLRTTLRSVPRAAWAGALVVLLGPGCDDIASGMARRRYISEQTSAKTYEKDRAEVEQAALEVLRHRGCKLPAPPWQNGKTVEGEPLMFRKAGGAWWVIDAKGDKARITIPNVMQSNGVIHVIDAVLMP